MSWWKRHLYNFNVYIYWKINGLGESCIFWLQQGKSFESLSIICKISSSFQGLLYCRSDENARVQKYNLGVEITYYCFERPINYLTIFFLVVLWVVCILNSLVLYVSSIRDISFPASNLWEIGEIDLFSSDFFKHFFSVKFF